MCPEQLRGEAVDAGWDVWALAVIAYEMLSGTQPFEGATVASLHAAVLSGRRPPLAQILPQAPPAWEAFFADALAPDRAVRPAGAGEFLRRFEHTLAAQAAARG